jgi:hypothetical protein
LPEELLAPTSRRGPPPDRSWTKKQLLELIRKVHRASEQGQVPELAAESKETSWELQWLIEHLDQPSREALVHEFFLKVAWSCKDKNAHHVILKLIEYCSFTSKTPVTNTCIFHEFRADLWSLSRNKFACQVGRDLFIHCSTHLFPLVEDLRKSPYSFHGLCLHTFGKHVAVAVLDSGVAGSEKLLDHVERDFEVLCCNEEGAAVVASALRKKDALVGRLLSQYGLVVSLARSLYGREAVEDLLKKPQYKPYCEKQLEEGLDRLIAGGRSSRPRKEGLKLARAMGLIPKNEAATA